MTTLLDEPRKIEKSSNGQAVRSVIEARDDEAPTSTPAPITVSKPVKSLRRSNRLPVKRLLGAVVLAGAIIAGSSYGYSYWKWSARHESTDNAFIDGHIVQVSPRVAGHVARVYVNDNQVVKAGDLLIELDPSDYQSALDEAAGRLTAAKADRAAAESDVEEARSQVKASEASVDQAGAEATRYDAELNRAKDDLAQYTKARETAAVSSIEFGKIQTAHQTAQAAADAAHKAVAAAEAKVGQDRSSLQSKEARVSVAQAQIDAAQAAVDRAMLNLSYTKITAASDGRITKKSVEAGNYIIPAMPVMALVEPDVWVTANFKETQLAHMKAGQPVEIEVDAYPGLKLKGYVDSIQQGAGARFSLLPPENATGNYVKVVQRVPVKIGLEGVTADGPLLGPGMSVVPVVETR